VGYIAKIDMNSTIRVRLTGGSITNEPEMSLDDGAILFKFDTAEVGGITPLGLQLGGAGARASGIETSLTLGSTTKIPTSGAVTDACPIISSGTSAPATTPTKVGDMYINTSTNKLYIATGTASSADWTITN
jgi:hypothetical protein